MEKRFDHENDLEIPVVKMSKLLFQIWTGEGDQPKTTVQLDRKSRAFIHVTVSNVFTEYYGSSDSKVGVNSMEITEKSKCSR